VNAALLSWRRHALAVVLALVFLGANVGFFLWYRATTRLRAGALEKERAALASDVAAREQEARRLVAQRDRIAGVAEAIQEFYGKRVGGRRETLAPVVDEMHGVFQKVGVFPSQISYSTTAVASLSLTEMLVSFGYSTDYPTFKKLLTAIETDPRWFVVRQFALNRDAQTTNTVQMRIVLGTYFAEAREPGAPVRRAGTASPRPRAAS
jgi:hypothetical protein